MGRRLDQAVARLRTAQLLIRLRRCAEPDALDASYRRILQGFPADESSDRDTRGLLVLMHYTSTRDPSGLYISGPTSMQVRSETPTPTGQERRAAAALALTRSPAVNTFFCLHAFH